MATVSKSITLAAGAKAVYAVFTGTEFYKAIGLKATVSAAVGGKYKISAMSGTVLAARKEQMIVRTLRDESMAKDVPDMVSVFTFAENKEKKETVLNLTIANVPEKLADKISGTPTYLVGDEKLPITSGTIPTDADGFLAAVEELAAQQ